MEELFPLLPDAGAAVTFVLFLYLWHKRAQRRDEMFREIYVKFADLLGDCLKTAREGDRKATDGDK